MKVCHNCSTEVSADSKFCTSCGTQLGEGTSDQVTQAKEEASATAETASATNEYAEQGKELAKGYWDHLVHMFKSPLRHGKTEGEGNFVNGIITLVLFTLFVTTIFYLLLSATNAGISEFNIFGGEVEQPGFGETFMKPLLFILLFVGITAGVVFGVAKPSVSELNFKEVIGRFGALMVIPTALMLLSLFFYLIEAYSIFAFILLIAYAAFFTAAAFTIYSYVGQSKKGLDGIYGVLILGVVTLLSLQFIFENLFVNVFARLFAF